MVCLKFCANLSFMFNENGTLLERYESAAQLGFKAVECAFPYEFSVGDVVKAKTEAQVDQILINADPGDLASGDLGLAAMPGREEAFRASLANSINYAKALECNRLHIMAGKCLPGIVDTAMGDVYKDNLIYAADLLEGHGITGLIEPICPFAVPNYYMNSFSHALQLIKDIDKNSMKLQVDVYHLQMLEGNLTHRIKELLPYIGHIQISQAPNRHEPDTDGEIDYRYLLNLLEKYGYDGYIGLEYKPSVNSIKSVEWITKWGYSF